MSEARHTAICGLAQPTSAEMIETNVRNRIASVIMFASLTLRITGSKKQREKRAVLFAVRVHAIVIHMLLTLFQILKEQH